MGEYKKARRGQKIGRRRKWGGYEEKDASEDLTPHGFTPKRRKAKD